MNTPPPPSAPAADGPVTAVVLAAGLGTRLGGRVKGLLRVDGLPLLRRTLLALRDGGVDQCLLVARPDAVPALAEAAQGLIARLLIQPRPERGQGSSLQLGLQAVPAQSPLTLVALSDQPLLATEDIRALLQAYQARPAGTDFLLPVRESDGQPGNPVLFSRAVREAMLAGAAMAVEQGREPLLGRQWRQANAARVRAWRTHRAAFFEDLDTEADLARIAQAHGLRLDWPQPGAAA